MDYQGGDIEYGANAEKYPLLRGLARLLRAYGYGSFIVAAVSFLWIMFGMEWSRFSEGLAFIAAAVTAAGFVGQGFLMLMLSEVPAVFMDTEQNSRGILAHLEQEARQRRAVNDPRATPAAAAARTADLSARIPKVPGP